MYFFAAYDFLVVFLDRISYLENFYISSQI